MVRDFIKKNKELWRDKKVFCVATMGLFSEDETGCSARLLKRYKAIILGGLHIKMPDSICDNKLLKRHLKRTETSSKKPIKNRAHRTEYKEWKIF